jgi:hypothetical protein
LQRPGVRLATWPVRERPVVPFFGRALGSTRARATNPWAKGRRLARLCGSLALARQLEAYARASGVAELSLRALRAVERELRRLVVGQPRLPAILVGWQPESAALRAGGDQRDALGVHATSLGDLLDHEHRRLVCVVVPPADHSQRPATQVDAVSLVPFKALPLAASTGWRVRRPPSRA